MKWKTRKRIFYAVAAAILIGCVGGIRSAVVFAKSEGDFATLKLIDATVKMGGEYGENVWYDVTFDADELFYLVNNTPTSEGITLKYSLTEESRDGDIIGTTRMTGHLLQAAGYNAWGACNTNGIIDFQTRGGWGDRSVTYGKEATFVYDAETHTRTINGNSGGYLLSYSSSASDYYVGDTGEGCGVKKDDAEYSVYGYMDEVLKAQYFGLATDGGTYSATGKYWCFDSANNALGLALCIGEKASDLIVFTDLSAMPGTMVSVVPQEKAGYSVTGLKNVETGEVIEAAKRTAYGILKCRRATYPWSRFMRRCRLRLRWKNAKTAN